MPRRPSDPVPSSLPLDGLAILVLEGSFLVADEMRRHLERLGAAVVGPIHGEREALRTLASTHVDCAVLEVILPDVKTARGCARSNIPVVFVSGYDRAFLPADLREAPLLEKPVIWPELAEAILAAVQTSGQTPH